MDRFLDFLCSVGGSYILEIVTELLALCFGLGDLFFGDRDGAPLLASNFF